jgi:F0F1-type ATP synthase delta subunit
MTPKDLLTEISNNCYSYFQLIHQVRLVKQSLESKFYNKDETKEEITQEDTQLLEKITPKLSSITKDNFASFFDNVNKEISNLIPLIVYIPFEMPETEFKQLGDFVKEKFGSHILIELRFDPTLIGGCSLVWKGQFKDYSLKSKMTQNKEEIFSTFKSFLK